jgi:hypothetical protein
VVIAGSRVHDWCSLLKPSGRVAFAFSVILARKRGGNGNNSCDIGGYGLIADGLIRILLFPIFDQLSRYFQFNFCHAADARSLDRVLRPDSKLEIKKLFTHELFDVPPCHTLHSAFGGAMARSSVLTRFEVGSLLGGRIYF